MGMKKNADNITSKAKPKSGASKSAAPPFETQELRKALVDFLDMKVGDSETGEEAPVGNFRWGVYAFYDYDGEPIYVGQTNERLRTRIRRHLTNQRTDAVAMKVLDPFEVHTVTVWPLPQFDHVTKDSPKNEKAEALAHLNALELAIYNEAIRTSKFGAILNEKRPLETNKKIKIPRAFTGTIVSERVKELRGHPDIRIARRASTLASLAQIVSERLVQSGLRATLEVQAKRLAWLAEQRARELAAKPDLNDDEDEEI